MTNEETRLINNEQEPGGQPKVQNQTVNNGVGAAPIKSNKKSSSFAAAAGGFVGGAAAGAATTAAATPSAQEIPQEIEASETVDTNTVNTTAEAPNPNDVILANDEGIRYAHVDADNFNDAFAQAREQVGPGGVFEFDGKIYATYYAEEWNSMSSQERSDFQHKIFEDAPTYNAESANTGIAETPAGYAESTPDMVATDAEMIDVEAVDDEIHVLGVEAVENEDGNIMNIAVVECEGEQALLVDVDNNGTIDVLIHDGNADGLIQESEIHDISDAQLTVADLLQTQDAQDDMLYASYDDMPDYINDADTLMSV